MARAMMKLTLRKEVVQSNMDTGSTFRPELKREVADC
jgi:hypothetical protein